MSFSLPLSHSLSLSVSLSLPFSLSHTHTHTGSSRRLTGNGQVASGAEEGGGGDVAWHGRMERSFYLELADAWTPQSREVFMCTCVTHEYICGT